MLPYSKQSMTHNTVDSLCWLTFVIFLYMAFSFSGIFFLLFEREIDGVVSLLINITFKIVFTEGILFWSRYIKFDHEKMTMYLVEVIEKAAF